MPRPLRLEYPGALYHVTARGVQQGAIYLDDVDRTRFLALVARTLVAGDARALAFCLMGNHYHFVLQTGGANLSALMQRINSVHSLTFNRRHDRRGHVFESRLNAVHVDRQAYLLEVCRYVDLNPVRAKMCDSPRDWCWSSYRAHVGIVAPPRWLATLELHAALMGNEPASDAQLRSAQRCYADWVEGGRGVRLWDRALLEGRFLGNQAFVQRVQASERE